MPNRFGKTEHAADQAATIAGGLVEAVQGSRPAWPGEAADVTAADDGFVEVTKGRETYFPIKYNGFDVGPVTVRTKIRVGEVVGDAYGRAHAAAQALFRSEFDVALDGYLTRLAAVGEEVARRRVKGA